jgi:hypothetical protein
MTAREALSSSKKIGALRRTVNRPVGSRYGSAPIKL